MNLRLPVRPMRAALAALAGALLLASCSSAPPPVAAPPPPAPPPAPSIAMAPRLIEMASAYRGYMSRTTGITPAFADGSGVSRSVQTGAAYEPDQMVRGAIAYGAVVALQDKAFVQAVRVFAGDREQRQRVTYEILRDPAYVLGFPTASNAAGLVAAALGGDAQSLYDQGKAVKQAAYDIQHQPWSKSDVEAREARLAQAKSVSTAGMMGDVAETTRLQQASLGAAPMSLPPSSVSATYTPTVVRGLAVAALAALGQAGETDLGPILAMMNEPNVGRCMSMSKLNLYQCLAVARPHYEDVFCLGQHAMMDTGRCMIKAAGQPEPYEARFVPDAKSIARDYPAPKPPMKKARRKG